MSVLNIYIQSFTTCIYKLIYKNINIYDIPNYINPPMHGLNR